MEARNRIMLWLARNLEVRKGARSRLRPDWTQVAQGLYLGVSRDLAVLLQQLLHLGVVQRVADQHKGSNSAMDSQVRA